jgi:hypothetical protein
MMFPTNHLRLLDCERVNEHGDSVPMRVLQQWWSFDGNKCGPECPFHNEGEFFGEWRDVPIVEE